MKTPNKQWYINPDGYTVYVHELVINGTPTGKRYVGCTCMLPEYRYKRGYKGRFKTALEQYGWESFNTSIVGQGLDEDTAHMLERNLIAYFNTTNPEYGFNVTHGGEAGGALGRHHTKECKARIAKSMHLYHMYHMGK